MTQTGKCGTCRLRKVKCDEEKPKCGACKKKNRPCSYDYGKASAFVVQDPNQMTKHGKSKTTPLVYTLESSENNSPSSDSLSSGLRVTTERAADSGNGVFQTLAPASISKIRSSKKAEACQKKKLQTYLQHLQSGSLTIHTPMSIETSLITRYIDMIGPGSVGHKPLSVLGTWIESIPSRIGSNRMLDLAVEFMVNSLATYWDNTYSKRRLAEATKAKALSELQLAVVDTQGTPSYDVVLATKAHYAAEAFMGMDTMYHAIHAFGLAELLKMGNITGVDEEHFWNLLDNTYIDDVHEAMVTGRTSVYDNDYYLAATYPPAISTDHTLLSMTQRASLAIMHIFVQCPRMADLIRKAILHPGSTSYIASAVSLLEYLWQLDLSQHVDGLIKTSVTVVNSPVSPEMADIMPDSYHFDSIQSMILCTRYWMLINTLCGMTDTLHRRFPVEMAVSLLPDPEAIRQMDSNAGICLAKSLGWAQSGSQALPLVPLRVHGPLQLSMGAWHRLLRNSKEHLATSPDLEPVIKDQMIEAVKKASRMKEWLIEQCNRIHKQWSVSTVDEQPLTEALDAMAGEKIPDWLPTRVRFEAEDGNMVMKFDYERENGPREEKYRLGIDKLKWSYPGSSSSQDSPIVYESPNEAGSSVTPDSTTNFIDTPATSTGADSATSLTDVDLIFKTGRNLCQVSGWWHASSDTPGITSEIQSPGPYMASSWWPETPNVLTLPDRTHDTSRFQEVHPDE